MRRIVLILILILFVNTLPVHGDVDIPVDAGGGSSSGGGHRQIDFDRIFQALQEGKAQKPQKFEEMKKLLYIEPFTTKEYDKTLALSVDFKGNETLNRNQKFEVNAYLENPNPIEIRRALYLELNSLEPGEKTFRQVNTVPQIIQVNEYTETKDGRNYTYRTFPELTSFSNLKTVGPVILRLKATDGQYTWTSGNLTLNVINNPPMLSNLSIEATKPTRYNDPIDYVANLTDRDGDAVNVTLHVLDEQGKERGRESQIVLPGNGVSFLANQYGFFSKEDSGKNFTYYYTFGDGINVSNTTIQDGPRLRKSTSIWVDSPWVTPEDENQYWWQSYNFSINMKNQDPEETKVLVTLFTDTKAHPWKIAASQEVMLSQEAKSVYFNVKPFDVLDANQSFRFKFTYSEYDQHQKDFTEVDRDKPINAKLVKYETVSVPGVGNVLAILLVALVLSIFVERRFYR